MSYWDSFSWGSTFWSDAPNPVVIETLQYIDARGNVTDMSTVLDRQYKEGVDGRFLPPFEHLAEATPEGDGAVYRSTAALPRQLIVPVVYVADNITEIRGRLRGMAQALNPKRGVGKLRIVTQDGLDRYINCAYESGMDSNVDVGGDGWTQRVAYSFRAWDPYWYNVNPVERPPDKISTDTSTFFPTPPFRLGASTIFVTYTQNNGGDVEAWPVWMINGPGSDLQITNGSTGKYLGLGDYVIPPAGGVIIDTRPGIKSVVDFQGNNLWPKLQGSLWPLIDGPNDIVVEMLNATPDVSTVQLSYRERFLGV